MLVYHLFQCSYFEIALRSRLLDHVVNYTYLVLLVKTYSGCLEIAGLTSNPIKRALSSRRTVMSHIYFIANVNYASQEYLQVSMISHSFFCNNWNKIRFWDGLKNKTGKRWSEIPSVVGASKTGRKLPRILAQTFTCKLVVLQIVNHSHENIYWSVLAVRSRRSPR